MSPEKALEDLTDAIKKADNSKDADGAATKVETYAREVIEKDRTGKRLKELLPVLATALESGSFYTREAGTRAFRRLWAGLGDEDFSVLETYLKKVAIDDPDLEVRRRAQDIVQTKREGRSADPNMPETIPAPKLRLLRAQALLAGSDSADAQAALKAVAEELKKPPTRP